VKAGGLVEVVHAPASISDVGGLDGLKTWLKARRKAFGDDARAYGLPCPKGLLLVGCPGTGKSLVAKATAADLGLPLLRADAGRWFGGLVGESEKNVRSVIEIAEAIAPCVLWIDEIEKGLSGSQSSGATDGGTSSRVLGTILTWLNEKTSPVFVVATANNVAALPPETIRKGRFDELFFVDLPDASERADIWNIHIQKRRPGSSYDLAKLASMTEGFTGAEIEQTWIEAMYLAFAEGAEAPTVEHLETACASTVPLSKTASENIAAIRKWADGRARPANNRKVGTKGTPQEGGRKLSV
jgi:SpoVK/Ycf46/Vps4 family AAA+-type ATPase